MTKNIQLLLIGDNSVNGQFIRDLLENSNREFDLQTAELDDSLPGLLESRLPDLILISFSGIDPGKRASFFEALKPFKPVVSVIVLGGEDSAVEAVRYMQMGAADYIPDLKSVSAEFSQKIIWLAENKKRQNKQARTMETLGRISLALNATRDLPKLLDLICHESSQLFRVGSVFIWLLEGSELVGFAGYGYGREEFIGMRVPLSDPIIMGPRVIRENRPIFINDAENSPQVDQTLIARFRTKSILGTPLVTENRAIGALMLLDNVNPQRFEAEDVDLAWLLAGHAAIAIKNAQLFEATHRQLEELSVLHTVAVIGVKATDEDRLIEETTRIIGETFYPHNFGVLLLDETSKALTLHSSYRLENKPFDYVEMPMGVTGRVAVTGQPIRVNNVQESEFYLKGDPTTRSELCVPLKVGDRIMGVVNAESDQFASFTDNDERLLTTLASQLAVALERLRTETSERRQRKRLSIISELAREMAGLLEVADLYTIITERLLAEFDCVNVSIFLADSNSKTLTLQNNAGVFTPFLENGTYQQPFGEGLIGLAAVTGEPQIFNDTRKAPGFFTIEDIEIQSEAAIPLKVGKRLIGVLDIDSDTYGSFDSGDISTLLAIADQLAITIEKTRLFEETKQRSEDLESAQNILQSINVFPNVTNAFPEIARGLTAITGCDRASIALLEQEDTWFSIYALDQQRPELDQGARLPVALTACANDVLSGRVHLTPDLEQEIEFPAEKTLFEAGHRSRVNLPLFIEDRVIGSLNLVWPYLSGFDHSQLPLLSQLAQAIALAVEKTRLFTEARQRAKELDFLNRVIGATASARTGAEVLQIGCKEVAQFLDVPQAGLALLNEERTYATVVAEYLEPGRLSVMHERIPVTDNPAFQEILANGRPLVIEDVENTISIDSLKDLLARRGTVSLLIVPIPVRGRVIGTLGIDAIAPRTFTPEELRLVKTVGEELGRALETARLHEQLQAYAAELETRVSERTQELALANEQLKELDRLKSKFVSDVSHELRTPVANLWLYLDLLERGRSERRPHYLDILKKETKRLEQLIENTLNLTRIEKSDAKSTFEPVDLNLLVEQITAGYQNRAQLENLTFTFSPGEALPEIQGAKNQLAQVINNLLSNAFNYTETGFVKVRTYVDSQNKDVVLEIIDSGIGIDPDDLPHLFDRFYRGRQTGQSDIPGTGLGLAIAKEVVDLHNGSIVVDSGKADETVFRVRLPYDL